MYFCSQFLFYEVPILYEVICISMKFGLKFDHTPLILSSSSDALEQPFFTANPMGTTVINSNRHTISCQATGTMPIDYGWEINDTVIYSPEWSSNSYTFTTIGKSNIGVYRCVASNVVGTVISKGAEIHVACKFAFFK